MRYILMCLCLALTGCSTAMVDEIFGNQYDRIEYRDKVTILWINALPDRCGHAENFVACAAVNSIPLNGAWANMKSRSINQKNKVEHIDRIDWVNLADTIYKCFEMETSVWGIRQVNWLDRTDAMDGSPRMCYIWIKSKDLDYLVLAEEVLHCFGWHHKKGYELQWRSKTLEKDRKDWIERTRPSADEGLLLR